MAVLAETLSYWNYEKWKWIDVLCEKFMRSVFFCGCLCVSALKEQTIMVFIQLGQIKVNVAHSGAKQKSKNGTYGTIGTYQQNKKKWKQHQHRKITKVELKLTKNEKKTFSKGGRCVACGRRMNGLQNVQR